MITNKEFEDFLESIDGLENGYFTDRPAIKSRHFFSIGQGWLELTKNLIEELIANGWNKQICQVKEKFGCYDEQTEILTKNGWKFFKDCNNDSEYAILKDDGYLDYSKSSDTIAYNYSGKMYSLESRGISLLVTPNHNLYISKGNSQGKYKDSNTRKWDFEFATPDKYFRKEKRFLKSANWTGEPIENIIIKGYSYTNYMKLHNKNRTYVIKNQSYNAEHFLKFLGFYTAEGCCDPEKGEIAIAACNDFSEKAAREQCDFEEVLTNNGFEIKRTLIDSSALVYKIYNKALAIWLSENIRRGASNKKCPSFIKNLTPELIKLYLIWLYRGDGHKSKSANTLYTTSKQLSDDVQELLVKVGNTFSHNLVTKEYINSKTKKELIIESKYDCHCINWLTHSNDFNIEKKCISGGQKYREEWTDYHGMVYCVTVPNNKLFIRRNGKGVWCGNSLRFYSNSMNEECHQILKKYEKLADETCEICGEKGELTNENRWYRTLCEKHKTKTNEESTQKENITGTS